MSVRIPEKDAYYNTEHVVFFRAFKNQSRECFLQLSDIMAALGMRQSIVCVFDDYKVVCNAYWCHNTCQSYNALLSGPPGKVRRGRVIYKRMGVSVRCVTFTINVRPNQEMVHHEINYRTVIWHQKSVKLMTHGCVVVYENLTHVWPIYLFMLSLLRVTKLQWQVLLFKMALIHLTYHSRGSYGASYNW